MLVKNLKNAVFFLKFVLIIFERSFNLLEAVTWFGASTVIFNELSKVELLIIRRVVLVLVQAGLFGHDTYLFNAVLGNFATCIESLIASSVH